MRKNEWDRIERDLNIVFVCLCIVAICKGIALALDIYLFVSKF